MALWWSIEVKERCSHSPSHVCDLSVFVPHSEPWRFSGRSSSIMAEKLPFSSPHRPSQALDLSQTFHGISSYCDILIKVSDLRGAEEEITSRESTYYIYQHFRGATAVSVMSTCGEGSLRRILWQPSAAPPCVFYLQRHQPAFQRLSSLQWKLSCFGSVSPVFIILSSSRQLSARRKALVKQLYTSCSVLKSWDKVGGCTYKSMSVTFESLPKELTQSWLSWRC